MTVIDLADKRPPACYTVHLVQHWDGRLEIMVQDVADDDRSRLAVADAIGSWRDKIAAVPHS